MTSKRLRTQATEGGLPKPHFMHCHSSSRSGEGSKVHQHQHEVLCEMKSCALFFLWLSFCLDAKRNKKIKAVEKILEILNISGRPTQTPHSFKNDKQNPDASNHGWTFLKLLVYMGRSLPYDVGISTDFLKGHQHQHEVYFKEVQVFWFFLCVSLCEVS